ncbi:MAG TPA: response regulator transcription factor [Candidatus Thermoplasmatota archaeon]|nr:response regulator transcription factor [Candidatus Thermoplasmatota archaeon]
MTAIPAIRQRTVSVVIADDVAALRELLRYVLEEAGGFDVVAEASDGEEAVQVVERIHPRLLLLDLAMPRLDGLEALPRIRAISPETRIVVFSGFTADRMENEAVRLGAAAYVEKGALPDEIVARLRAVLTGGTR